MNANREALNQAGYGLRPWCASADISPATFYNLPEQIRPKSVKVGKRRIIVEQPADWLRRVGQSTEA